MTASGVLVAVGVGTSGEYGGMGLLQPVSGGSDAEKRWVASLLRPGGWSRANACPSSSASSPKMVPLATASPG